MLIGVLSDSHDHLPPLRKAVAMCVERNVEAIFHAGDFIAPFAAKLIAPPNVPAHIPVHCCYGNNDGERAGLKNVLPQVVDGTFSIELGGRRIVMNHFIDWFAPGETAGAHIVISGHTHAVVNEMRDGQLVLNPGEVCGWVNDRRTLAVVDTATLAAEIIDIA